MHPLALAALLCAQPDATVTRVTFENLTIKDAERLDGKAVVATFTVAKPAYTWGEGKRLRTIIGPADNGGTERAVVLKGDRLHDADLGAKVTVLGTLRVIRHTATMTGSAWTEIRIEE